MEKEIKKEQKLNNKGFSLVELIIVMAIMAILIGVVGTQVIPYMNNAKESKDNQVISSIATAAVTAATECAEKFDGTGTYSFTLLDDTVPAKEFEKDVKKRMKELTYDEIGDDSSGLQKDLKSEKGNNVKNITVSITKKAVTVTPTGDSGKEVLPAITSPIGD